MDGNLKLLVLDLKDAATLERDGLARALDSVADTGTRVHESSGRILVVDSPDPHDSRLGDQLPGARLLPLDADVPELDTPLDDGEALFLDALRIRASAGYQRQKASQKAGESPEEQLMFTASCVRDGESDGE